MKLKTLLNLIVIATASAKNKKPAQTRVCGKEAIIIDPNSTDNTCASPDHTCIGYCEELICQCDDSVVQKEIKGGAWVKHLEDGVEVTSFDVCTNYKNNATNIAYSEWEKTLGKGRIANNCGRGKRELATKPTLRGWTYYTHKTDEGWNWYMQYRDASATVGPWSTSQLNWNVTWTVPGGYCARWDILLNYYTTITYAFRNKNYTTYWKYTVPGQTQAQRTYREQVCNL